MLETGISQPPSYDALVEKAVVSCETIISWDFGIEEGTFRRVSFGPATGVSSSGEDDDEEQIQPIWPGSWGNAINEFVVNLFFKVTQPRLTLT